MQRIYALAQIAIYLFVTFVALTMLYGAVAWWQVGVVFAVLAAIQLVTIRNRLNSSRLNITVFTYIACYMSVYLTLHFIYGDRAALWHPLATNSSFALVQGFLTWIIRNHRNKPRYNY